MKDFIKECQAIAKPLTHRSYPFRPNLSPFTKRPKATSVKRCKQDTRCNIEKPLKPRKINVGYCPEIFQLNWLAKAEEVEAITQAPTSIQPAAKVVIPTTYPTSCSISYIHSASHHFSSICPANRNLA